jgi:hypothetical protein
MAATNLTKCGILVLEKMGVLRRNTETKSKKVCVNQCFFVQGHIKNKDIVFPSNLNSHKWWKHLCVAHNVKLWI